MNDKFKQDSISVLIKNLKNTSKYFYLYINM